MKFRLGPDSNENTAAPSSSSAKDAFGEMRVEVYKLISQAKKSSTINLHSSTNLPLKSITKFMDDNGKTLHEEDMKQYLLYAGSRVYFTKSEYRCIRDLGFTESILSILYFTDAKAITSHPEYNIRSPYFIVPDEKQVKGSSTLFFSILEGMIKDGVIAIAVFKLASVTTPRLVALIPQSEEIDEEDGVQILPGGMHLVFLPWQEEMRSVGSADNQLVIEAKTMVTKEMVDAAVQLSKSWQFEETSGRVITGTGKRPLKSLAEMLKRLRCTPGNSHLSLEHSAACCK